MQQTQEQIDRISTLQARLTTADRLPSVVRERTYADILEKARLDDLYGCTPGTRQEIFDRMVQLGGEVKFILQLTKKGEGVVKRGGDGWPILYDKDRKAVGLRLKSNRKRYRRRDLFVGVPVEVEASEAIYLLSQFGTSIYAERPVPPFEFQAGVVAEIGRDGFLYPDWEQILKGAPARVKESYVVPTVPKRTFQVAPSDPSEDPYTTAPPPPSDPPNEDGGQAEAFPTGPKKGRR